MANWKEMDALESAFNQIHTVEFLVDRLQRSVDKQDKLAIVDITAALLAFLPTYTANFEEKFRTAWNATVTPENND